MTGTGFIRSRTPAFLLTRRTPRWQTLFRVPGRVHAAGLVVGSPPASFFGGGAARFFVEAADLGAERRPGGAAAFRHDLCTGNQFVKSRQGFGSIGLLCSMHLRRDDQHAVLRDPMASQRPQALTHSVRERAGLTDVEP